MHGDFTRLFNNQEKGFSRLLLQQGRVLIDSDFNEAEDILTRAIRTLAEVVIGPHGGEPEAFLISAAERGNDLTIGPGRYYVQGVLSESDGAVTYLGQFDDERELPDEGTYLAYLDVWEQHVTSLQEPDIREVALGGPDTATRARIRWQVRLMLMRELPEGETIEEWLAARTIPLSTAVMRARTKPARKDEDPCITAPDSRYRGAENQLYRVEIHAGNVDHDGQEMDQEPTIKWSRENGAVIYPVEDGPDLSDDGTVTFVLAHLGWDDGRFGLSPGDWVEFLNDNYARYEEAGPLLKVQMVDSVARQVTVVAPEGTEFRTGSHPLLRCWDHKSESEAGAIPVSNCGPEGWLKLEDHIEVCFATNVGDQYRTGDYWLIPARTVTGDIIWPGAKATAARGVIHYYAPLARVSIGTNGPAIEEHYRRCVTLAATVDACPAEEEG